MRFVQLYLIAMRNLKQDFPIGKKSNIYIINQEKLYILLLTSPIVNFSVKLILTITYLLQNNNIVIILLVYFVYK